MNPFKVLNVDKHVSQKEVVVAVARAMREKQYSAKEIAIAQQSLLDPVSRAAYSFLLHIDLSDEKEQLRREIMAHGDEALHGDASVKPNDADDISERESLRETGAEAFLYLEGIFD